MKCSHCRAENPSSATFCDECGTRLESPCPNCGEPNRHGAKFCRNCGKAIIQSATKAPTAVPGVPVPDTYVPKYLAKKILASRHKLEGERKQVTVLFADIRGSTKLLETLDPEEAQKILDPVLRIMMDSVHRYEGTVNQVLGDGIMALFGAPLAHEDHALRACYAALTMQEEMHRYRRQLGQPALQIGVGLNSGEVVVRSIDNDLNIDYSAIGHTTNLASRMQTLAGPDVVLMSTNTLRQVEGFVRVESLGPVQVKGVSRPVETYSLLGTTSARTRVQASLGRGLTPLVGRSTEIDTFKNIIQRTSAGRGQILAMVGEPGMGKSRLVHEFTRHQLPAGWLVLDGASASYAKATSYFPIVEMLRRYFVIGGEKDSDVIQNRVVTQILELDSSLKDTIAPILSLLEVSPGVNTGDLKCDWLAQKPDILEMIMRFNSMDPPQRRRLTLDALKRIWITESRRQNLLLVFEDLHWTDNETQAFLDVMVESLPMGGLLLLVNYRPEYNHEWSDKSYYTQLRVEPLQASSSEEFLSKLLGNHPDLSPLKELLNKRTEGNPFFAEESVRSLAETGLLIGEKGAYRRGLTTDNLVIPSTVQNLVADRIDRLPAEGKHLLQTAAVIGAIVPFDLLQAVSELTDDSLLQHLVHLQSAEFIYESNLFPKLEYTFKHSLTHEVAYGALLHERRIDLHAKIMSALETMTETPLQDHLEMLAHHSFLGQRWEKAVAYLKEAAIKSLTRSANSNAVWLLERALTALDRWPESRDKLVLAIDLRLMLRNPLFLLGEFERLYHYLKEAEGFAETLADQQRLGSILNFIISYFTLMGDHKRAVEIAQRACNVGEHDISLNVVSHYYLGIAFYQMGRYRESISVLTQVISQIENANLQYERFGTANIISVICRVWKVQSLAQLGVFQEGFLNAQEAIQIAEEAQHPYSLAYAHCSHGFLLLIRGEINEAIGILEECRKFCRNAEIRVLFPQIASYLGLAYALAGRFDEAIPLMEKADEESEAIGRKAGQSLRLTWQGHVKYIAGRLDEAERIADMSLELAKQYDEEGHRAWTLKLLGDIGASKKGRHREAESYYGQALGLSEKLEMIPLQGHTHFALGQFYSRGQDRIRACTEFIRAVEFYKKSGMGFWQAHAEKALHELSAFH